MLNDPVTSRTEGRLFHYKLWAHHVISEIDLGEIEQYDAPSPQAPALPKLYCNLVPQDAFSRAPGELILECPNIQGSVWLAFRKDKSSYLAVFPGLCTFRIMLQKRRIECAPVAGIAPSTIAHLLLDHAIPRFLSLQTGYLVLHACAVLVDGHAMAILGHSGTGKSTLATYLASNGLPLVTDDCLVLRWDDGAGHWLAEPGYRSVRLWSDSSEALGIGNDALTEFAHYTEKKRTSSLVNMHHAVDQRLLKACFVLAQPTESGQPVIEPMSPAEGFQALLGADFRLDPDNPELNSREFAALADVLASTRFYSLSYERDYALLPAIQRAIIEAMRDPSEVYAI